MSGFARCPVGCGRAVLYATTGNRRNLPLNPTPDPAGQWIPIAGRAWQRWELIAAGKPDWADAPAHVAHPVTCKLWHPKAPDPVRGSAQGHLACMACGTLDATVRHMASPPDLDLCSHCRPSTVDRSKSIPTAIPGKITQQETA